MVRRTHDRRSIGLALCATGFFLGLGLACASGTLVPVALRDAPVVLGLDEGILIVDVDANVPINRLRIGPIEVLRLDPGRNVRLLRVPAGRYRIDWADELPAPDWRRVGADGRVVRFEFQWLEGNQFDVLAGRINYAGRLILRRDRESLNYTARLVNRSSAALAYLQDHHPILLRTVPLQYTGPSRDDFFDVYLEASRGRSAVVSGAGS